MIQVIITPEAIKTMGIKHVTHVAISELKRLPSSDWRSIIFLEGVSNVQIANILKTILAKVDTAFSITTRVPSDKLHAFTDDTEVQIKHLDAQLN